MSIYVNWFEIPVADYERACDFYSKVFRVKVETILFDGEEKHGYLKLDKVPSGVLVKRDGFAPGLGAVLFFHVVELSSTLRRAEENGARILIPKTLMTKANAGQNIVADTLIDDQMGYYAKFVDSEGNEVALHANS